MWHVYARARRRARWPRARRRASRRSRPAHGCGALVGAHLLLRGGRRRLARGARAVARRRARTRARVIKKALALAAERAKEAKTAADALLAAEQRKALAEADAASAHLAASDADTRTTRAGAVCAVQLHRQPRLTTTRPAAAPTAAAGVMGMPQGYCRACCGRWFDVEGGRSRRRDVGTTASLTQKRGCPVRVCRSITVSNRPLGVVFIWRGSSTIGFPEPTLDLRRRT